MLTLRLGSPLALLLLLLLPTASAQAEASWPGLRGPQKTPSNVFPEGSFGLVQEWQRPLGSGYSGFAITGDHVITQFTDGDDDVLAAFRSHDGEEIWRYRVADKYAGHDSSDDGPLSTPAVAGDRVVALGAKGQLVAVALDDGRQLWRVQLDEHNSTPPFYGYTASPLIVNDLVILATGGEGHAITAFDLTSGDVRWRSGDDSVTYQTPVLTDLAGHRQIVAVTDQWVYGLEPADGSLLWRYRHSEGRGSESSAHPTATDAHHVLLNLEDGSLMLEINEANGSFTAEEAWRSQGFGNSLVLPTVHEGILYGFTGRILTSVDAETGEILWRSRGVGGLNLTLVDNHLISMDRADGEVVVVRASAAGYQEKARLAVFERGNYADIAYADDRFFVRNLSHMAAFRIDRQAAAGVGRPDDPHRIRGALGTLVTALRNMPEGERPARVEQWLEGKTLPFVEIEEGGAGLAHFIYRGKAEDIAVSVDFPGQAPAEFSLHQVPASDLFYRTLELDPAGQWPYRMSIDYGQNMPDPANSFPVIDRGFASFSELRMPKWTASPHIEALPDDAPRGSLDTFRFASKILGNARQIQVWMPPGYQADGSYPVVVINDGERALRDGMMATVLDRVVGKTVAPVVVVFVPPASRGEYSGERAEAHTRFLTDELMPHIDRHYQTKTEGRAIFGAARAGAAAIHTSLLAPEVFQRAAVQSIFVGEPLREMLNARIKAEGGKPEHIYVEWSRHDYHLPQRDIDTAADSKSLLEKLGKQGVETTEDIVTGAAGWGSWRAQTHRLLEAFFPLPE